MAAFAVTSASKWALYSERNRAGMMKILIHPFRFFKAIVAQKKVIAFMVPCAEAQGPAGTLFSLVGLLSLFSRCWKRFVLKAACTKEAFEVESEGVVQNADIFSINNW